MNRARVVVLALALGAGGVAAYLVGGTEKHTPQAAPVAQIPTVEVLVAKSDIGLGQTVRPEDLLWQTWPAASASSSFIRRSDRPQAPKELIGSIARSPFMTNEPILEQKLVKADGSGFMAAILPSGMRAVSTEISAETGAGGFILPNDRVDVVLSKRTRSTDGSSDAVTQTVLSNIRVLAIDQAPKEKNGQTAVVGKTATLELKPDEVAVLARARASGTLSLALRSIADGKRADVASADSTTVTVYRGASSQDALTCDPLCR